jgi:carbon storage regulator
MLIIRRKPHESVLIGQDVEVHILDSSAGKVTLGIVAPRHVRVLRKEIVETFDQNRAAAQAEPALALPAIRNLLHRSDSTPLDR